MGPELLGKADGERLLLEPARVGSAMVSSSDPAGTDAALLSSWRPLGRVPYPERVNGSRSPFAPTPSAGLGKMCPIFSAVLLARNYAHVLQ